MIQKAKIENNKQKVKIIKMKRYDDIDLDSSKASSNIF